MSVLLILYAYMPRTSTFSIQTSSVDGKVLDLGEGGGKIETRHAGPRQHLYQPAMGLLHAVICPTKVGEGVAWRFYVEAEGPSPILNFGRPVGRITLIVSQSVC